MIRDQTELVRLVVEEDLPAALADDLGPRIMADACLPRPTLRVYAVDLQSKPG